jgi:hypothetical protein
LPGLQASANSGCHLCSLIIGAVDKEALKELNEEVMASSGSYNRCLCVAVELGKHPQLKILGSRVSKRGLNSLSYDTLSLEPGEAYCLNHIVHIPSFNIDLHVLDSKPQLGRIFVHRARSANTIHDRCLSLMHKWIQDCCRSHSLCRQSLVPDQKLLLRRLLEISFNHA